MSMTEERETKEGKRGMGNLRETKEGKRGMGNLREGEKGIRNSRETEEEGTEWKT